MKYTLAMSLLRTKAVTTWTKQYYSGVCVCGHSWDVHHLCMVMNLDYFNQTGECTVPQECEFYGCNEYGGLDAQGNEHCGGYVDKDDPTNGINSGPTKAT